MNNSHLDHAQHKLLRPAASRRSRRSQLKTFSYGLSLLGLVSAPLLPVAQAKPPVQNGTVLPSTTQSLGQWSPVLDWGGPSHDRRFVPINMMVLPNGKVLGYARDPQDDGNPDGRCLPTQPFLWDPAAPAQAPALMPALTDGAGNPGSCLFCSGDAFLPDGRLLVSGGHLGYAGQGIPDTNIYDFATNTWTRGASMAGGRWYPTNTTLPSGEVLAVAGEDNTIFPGSNPLPEVWKTDGSGWRPLSTARLYLSDYPWMFVAPNGKVFNAGPDPMSRYLDTSGSGTWTDVAASRFGYRGGYVGSAVMYAPGKVLMVGGGSGDSSTNRAEVINLNDPTPAWREVAPMSYPRRHLNATLLPDGKVLVTGGTQSANDPAQAVFATELWDPATEAWTTLAPSNGIPRMYHSSAALLPDGRVLMGGGGLPDFDPARVHPDVEIYSPPYLFTNSHRPEIKSAPTSVTYGQTFFVKTPDFKGITRVNWIRLSATTHCFNMSQRLNSLTFTPGQGGLSIAAPASANLCPPGHYMLFLLNGDGVPSVAGIVQIQ